MGDGDLLDRVRAFLDGSVMGRRLVTAPLSYKLENGKLEGLYSDQMTFSGLARTRRGLYFDLTVVASEKVYALDADGGRGELRQDFDNSAVFSYELALRRSTGELTGFMRFAASSMESPPAEAMASLVWQMRFEAGQLRWQEKEILYRDMPAADGSHRPAAFEARCRLFLENGKARYEYDGACLDVNPEDWSRSPSDAVIPRFLATEP